MAKESKRILMMALLLFALFILSFAWGRFEVPIGTVIRILWSGLSSKATLSGNEAVVVQNVRLPRILLAMLVGSCLSAAGCTYQGIFRNPMASPDLLGASAGAAFGAAFAILQGWSNAGVTLSAFCFSLLTVLLVVTIAQRAKGEAVLNLVLSGMVISSLFSAGTSYMKLVADPSNQLPAITYWLMGSLSGSRMESVEKSLLPMLLGLSVLFALRWRVNLLSMGDEEARSMGVNPRLLRLVLVLAATLVTASAIAVSGTIGWVGLVVPHICRKLVGSDLRKLLPASILSGAFFLLLTDNLARNLLATELPIGILTAFIGAPFFLYLMLKKEESR